MLLQQILQFKIIFLWDNILKVTPIQHKILLLQILILLGQMLMRLLLQLLILILSFKQILQFLQLLVTHF